MQRYVISAFFCLLLWCSVGCTTSTYSMGHGRNGTASTPHSVAFGKLDIENKSRENFVLFDTAFTNAVFAKWRNSPVTQAQYTADCKMSYSYERASMLEMLTGIGYLSSLTLICPLAKAIDLQCSLEFVVRDQRGKTVKTIHSGTSESRAACYVSLLPTSWLVRLFSKADVKKMGFAGTEYAEMADEAGQLMFTEMVRRLETGMIEDASPKPFLVEPPKPLS